MPFSPRQKLLPQKTIGKKIDIKRFENVISVKLNSIFEKSDDTKFTTKLISIKIIKTGNILENTSRTRFIPPIKIKNEIPDKINEQKGKFIEKKVFAIYYCS